jgi:hypothetical protein
MDGKARAGTKGRNMANRVAVSVVLMLVAAANAPSQQPSAVPENLRSMIRKSQSFGLESYPISFWSYTNLTEHGKFMDQAEVEEWADAGFTVPQSPSFKPDDPEQKAHILCLLDWARKRRMKLIVCDPRGYARRGGAGGQKTVVADYAEGVRAAARDFGSHPATFGFHVGDEPDAEMKEAFFESYRIQKEVAPHLHPFANLLPVFPGAAARAGAATWPEYLDEYVRKSNADLISYDCYTQMNPGTEGLHRYYENLREYRSAAIRNGVPFWNTLLSVGHFRYRSPNLDDIRWQFNTTLAFGAHGISWFFYYMRHPHENYRRSPVDEHWNRTQTYEDLRLVQKSFHRHYGDLFTRLASTRVSFYPEAFGGGEVFIPDGIVSQLTPDRPGHPLLIGEFTDLQGQRYVMIVNNSVSESVNVGVTFPGDDVKVYSWNWSGAEVEGGAYSATGRPPRDLRGLTIRHWLAPGQEAVYRVESASAAREPVTAK